MYFSRTLFALSAFLVPLFASAENTLYTQPLTRIPGITDETTLSNISAFGLAGFLNGIITFLFTAAAIASVLMIVMIGFEYATTEKSGPNVSYLKGKITSVAWGVGMIASMYIVFKFINPDIVNTLEIFSSARELGGVKAPDTTAQNVQAPADKIKAAEKLSTKITISSIVTLGGDASTKEKAEAIAQVYFQNNTPKCTAIGGTMTPPTYTEDGQNGYKVDCKLPGGN